MPRKQGMLRICACYKVLGRSIGYGWKAVSDEDLISYLISELNPRYNAFITSFTLMTKDESMSLANFQTFLLSQEQLLNSHACTEDVSQQPQAKVHQSMAELAPFLKSKGKLFIPTREILQLCRNLTPR
jgi:hypothetical protein